MSIVARFCALVPVMAACCFLPANSLFASGTNVVATPTEAALQAAINIGGVVTFGFSSGVIPLTNTVAVTNNVVLDATGQTVVINGNSQVRLFSVSSGVTFAATNLIFANGTYIGADGYPGNSFPMGIFTQTNGSPGRGAAIYDVGGTVQLTGCTLSNNAVSGGVEGGSTTYAGEGAGGAIYVSGGTLLLNGDILTGNSALGGPQDQYPSPGPGAANGFGGAVCLTNSSALIINCSFTSNTCESPTGYNLPVALGGALCLESGSVTLSNTVIALNTAAGLSTPFNGTTEIPPGGASGGGVAAISGNLTLLACQVSSNLAQGGNAYHNSGTGPAQGGGVFSSATIVVSNTSFAGNQALAGVNSSVNADGDGGALFNAGTASITACSFYSNSVSGGAAGNFGGINPNSANYPGGNGMGGAVFNGSQLSLTNCTIALNLARGGDGGAMYGIPGNGLGGGIFSTNGFSAMNVTLASNFVASGTGASLAAGFSAGADVANSNGTFAIKNTILAYGGGGTNGNAYGTITDGGYNLSSDGSASLTGSGTSFNSTDPKLRPLANYGGPTLTMALPASSPAVDAGTASGAPSTDERGFPRPSGPRVDIGAYELQQGIPSPAVALVRSQASLQVSFPAQTGGAYFLQGSADLTNWTNLQQIGPMASSSQVNLTITNTRPFQFYRLSLP